MMEAHLPLASFELYQGGCLYEASISRQPLIVLSLRG
ncbi:MAG: hypothetical protein JWO93_331 [Micrococcaceae bacterium]|nr:hypothetical protein [Micrococcaceae bacterium]